MVNLVVILQIVMIVIILYYIYLFRFKKPERARMSWTSRMTDEVVGEVKYLVIIVMAFSILIWMQSTPVGRSFTPFYSLILSVVILILWPALVVMPKNYAITEDGIFIRGTLYRWDRIRTVKKRLGMNSFTVVPLNPLIPPTVLVVRPEDVERVKEEIKNGLEKKESFRSGGRIVKIPKKEPVRRHVKVPKKQKTVRKNKSSTEGDNDGGDDAGGDREEDSGDSEGKGRDDDSGTS